MKAQLSTARALFGLPAALLFAATACMIVLIPTAPKVHETLQAMGIGILAFRMSRILASGAWRLLPYGHRTLVRATAIVVLTLSVSLGAAHMWAAPNTGHEVPFWPVLALFTSFSLLGLLLLTRIGQRSSFFLFVVYLLPCILSVKISMRHFSEFPWFWFTATAACAAIWLFASFGTLPRQLAGLRRRLRQADLATGRGRVRLNALAVGGSPVCTVLRMRRSYASVTLPIAALVLVIWAVMQHLVIGGRYPVDSFRTFLISQSAVIGALMLALAQRYAAAARLLWLRWGNSRRQVFRLVERNVAIDALVLGAVAWFAVTLFGVLRGLPLAPISAVKMLIACVGAGLAPAYLGLTWSTYHTWAAWQRVLAVISTVVALIAGSPLWLSAMGIRHGQIYSPNYTLLVLLTLAILGLRAFSAWRWSTLDWAHVRSVARKR